MMCPCKDCKDRHQACHDHCEKYKEWKKELEANKEALKRIKEEQIDFRGMNAGVYPRRKK